MKTIYWVMILIAAVAVAGVVAYQMGKKKATAPPKPGAPTTPAGTTAPKSTTSETANPGGATTAGARSV